MSQVRIDIIDGAKGKETADGLEIYRIATVSNLVGVASEMLKVALDTHGVPVIGDAHPSIDNMMLESREPELLHRTVVRIRLVYVEKITDEPQTVIEVGSSLRFVETDKDEDGNEIILEYKDLQGIFGKKDETYKQSGVYTRGVPTSTHVIRRRESSSPGAKSREYVGSFNEANWDVDPSAAEGTWRCNLIVGTSDDGGDTYDVRYEFEYIEEVWENELFFQKNGIIPDDKRDGVNDGKATKVVAPHPIKNFNGLNLV